MDTDDLIKHIQIIQLERKTGIMTVRRGQGTTSEEGTIAFVNGHVTEAKIGRRVGAEAFNGMCTWENCVFSFISTDISNARSSFIPLQPNRQSGLSERDTTPLTPISPLRKQDTMPLPATSPLRKQDTMPLPATSPLRKQDTLPLPATSPLRKQDTMPLPAISPLRKQDTMPLPATSPLRKQDTMPLPATSPLRKQTGSYGTEEKYSSQALPQIVHPHARPYHTSQFNPALFTIERAGFLRAHRQLFLLINGQRSVEELIYLVARSQEEVCRLLRDLQRYSLIHIPDTF